jgi:hypothetical protein
MFLQMFQSVQTARIVFSRAEAINRPGRLPSRPVIFNFKVIVLLEVRPDLV